MKLEIATKEMRHNRSQEVIESIHFELSKINSGLLKKEANWMAKLEKKRSEKVFQFIDHITLNTYTHFVFICHPIDFIFSLEQCL